MIGGGGERKVCLLVCVCVCVCVSACVCVFYVCVRVRVFHFLKVILTLMLLRVCVRCVCVQDVCESFNMRGGFCLLVFVWKTRGNQRKVKRANVKWQLGFFAKERKTKDKRGRKREKDRVHAFSIILQY